MGQLLAQQGDAGASKYLKEAIQFDPYDGANYLALASLEASLGQTANAKVTLRKPLEYAPANKEARRFLEQLKHTP